MVRAVDGSPLSEKQLARRQRVIRAALLLAAEGGYDAVHMRDVASASDVALGTIYRYFSSKDHLLAAALGEWTAELRQRVARQPARGDTPADRVVDVLRRACRAIEQIRGITAPLLVDLSAGELDDILAVLQHVWYSTLISWANGRRDVRTIGEELERAARLLLAPYSTLSPATPARSRAS